jgi:Domain of unknown function (DU1801)
MGKAQRGYAMGKTGKDIANTEIRDAGVKAVFETYPLPVRKKLLQLRDVIFDVAQKTPGVGAVEEALRWGQPSYITSETGSGSTIRIDQFAREPSKYSVYFICTSGLIDTFKELYRDEMHFVGNRSIVFDVADRLPDDALRHCISLALTHHLRKRAKS